MRVLLVHAFYRLAGGEDRYVREQQRLLSTRHEVRLYEAQNSDLGTSLAAAGAMLRGTRARKELAALVEGFRPDLIHLHNSYPSLGPSPFLVARDLGVPLVMTLHNYRLRCPNGYFYTHDGVCTRCEGGNYLNGIVHNCLQDRTQSAAYSAALWAHRFVFRVEETVERFICPSRFMAARMADAGLPEEKLTVLPNFVRENTEPSGERRHGLYVGRLSPEKGLDVLLLALAQAGDPPFKIIGTGPAGDALRRAATTHRLDNTEFLGHVSSQRVQQELKQARCVVVPSVWNENAPLAALEALAAGAPLIVSDIGGLPELIRTGAGHSFPAGDVRALRDLLLTFFRKDGVVEEMAKNSGDLFEAEYTEKRHLKYLEHIYGGVAGKSSQRLRSRRSQRE